MIYALLYFPVGLLLILILRRRDALPAQEFSLDYLMLVIAWPLAALCVVVWLVATACRSIIDGGKPDPAPDWQKNFGIKPTTLLQNLAWRGYLIVTAFGLFLGAIFMWDKDTRRSRL